MAKDLLGGKKAYWEDEDVLEGTDLFASMPEDVSLLDRLGSGVKQAFAGVGNTADTAGTLAWQGLAKLGGKTLNEEVFADLNKRIKSREDWAGKGDPGFAGKLAGVAATLPMQILTMPVSGIETAKQFIDQGETLGKAYTAGAIDTAGNVAGMALPGVVQGGKLIRAASGAGINAAQDTATRAAISGIADTQGAKDLFAPTWETAGLAAVPGAAMGVAFGKNKKQKTPMPKKDIGAIVASEAKGETPYGFKAGEYAGEIDKDLWLANRQQQEAQTRLAEHRASIDAIQERMALAEENARTAAIRAKNAQERDAIFARLDEEQRAAEQQIAAEKFVYENTPKQDTTGLSTGEGVAGDGRSIARTPVVDSGLMGLPQRPVEPPVGLSTGEGTPGSGLGPQRPMGPSNLMGETAPPVAAPIGLSTGEGVPGGRNIQRTPETSSGVMGVEPKPFDPFGSAGATPKRIGRFGQGGGIQMDLLLPKKLVDMLYKWRDAGGRMLIPDITRMVEDSGVRLNDDVRSILIEKYKNDDITQRYLNRVQKAIDANDFDRAQSRYKNLDNHLMTSLINEEEQGYNKYTPEQQEYRAKTGLYSKRDQARTEYERTINKFGQGGQAPMIGDLAQGIVRLGAGLKAVFTGARSETPDTLTTPTSPENIAAKTALRNKANAIGKSNSVYDNVTTVEEALANMPTKDIGSNQTLASGTEGVIRRNVTNGPLKFVRYLRTKAQTNTDALTAKYITGKDGFNETFRKLNDAEKMEVHETIQELSRQRVDYSDALADKLDLTPAQRAFMEARGRALKAVLDTANATNKSLGFELIQALPGYSPGMFASTYVSLVGRYEGEGAKKRWITEAVVNANSKWEYQKGLEHYKKQGKETINLDRRGLNTATKGGRNFDGTMKLLAALAEHDSRFADAKDLLDGFLKDQTKKLYNFDVHEMRKKGVEGNIGNKPWLDAKQNAKESLEAEVNYMDEAFKYWNYQEMLNKTKQLVDDPKMESLPNTRKYLDRYTKQVTGNNLHPMGAGINSLVDTVFENIGKAGAKVGLNIPENPNRVFAGAREFGSALMMNIYAPAFASIQLIQMFQAGIPESMKIRNEMGLDATAPVTAFAKALSMRTWFATMNKLGKLDEVPNSPMKEAYTWMREHGIDHYNEIQMSHEAAQNPKWTSAKNLAFWPTRLPEMITRPSVFMWYADMFHQAGLRGEDLHYTAKNATDYAMVNYHTDERPMVYQQLGVVGQSVGALRTFTHNAAEQMITRTKEAKQNPGAFLAMLGFTAGLMGVAGLPFYDEIDQWFIQPVTKRSGRDWMGEALHPALINGAASQYTGIDLQSRFSMADMIPGNPIEAVAGPQLSRMFQILDSGFGYIKNQDTKSFNELAKAAIPSGAYGAFEEARLVDEQGYVLDKEGQVKYLEPRTEGERKVRKVLGLRPLRERLEDEDLYTTKKLEQRMTDKQKDAYSRMRAGLNLKDQEGFDNAMQDYLDKEGDPKAIEQLVKRNAVQSQLSARQRQIVAPGKSVGSVNKYNRYWED